MRENLLLGLPHAGAGKGQLGDCMQTNIAGMELEFGDLRFIQAAVIEEYRY